MYCAKCGAVARKIHRPFFLRLLPLVHLYYSWPCHRRFLSFLNYGPTRPRALLPSVSIADLENDGSL